MEPSAWLGAGLARVVFYPTLLYTVLRGKLRGPGHREWYHRIDRTVLLGALPLRGLTRKLVQDENVRGVITMNEKYETRFLCNSSKAVTLVPGVEESGRRAAAAQHGGHDRGPHLGQPAQRSPVRAEVRGPGPVCLCTLQGRPLPERHHGGRISDPGAQLEPGGGHQSHCQHPGPHPHHARPVDGPQGVPQGHPSPHRRQG
ncbi:phosphatidylglycerophosphatase and protein-tyrosine phosphatase 1 isoform X1 [Heterocephalus glaber]|uniref:Phosphatidylglycerophosphatase and protein-tyrosine phosphatase 1 isoform X1 n=1 Tax=Heterocephalus glaber TaxID=10181 RepID=A0AAX6TFC0_HETGA|nr:phosphatidylglycerophosphatase and protein-tyrosine phosphatase 1 isoform X1 [Heterocephalus glaber]